MTWRATLGTTLTLAVAFLAGATSAQPNPVQEGENGTCADFNVLFYFPDMRMETIQVQGGTGFFANQSGGAQIYVDFYDADGRWISDNSRNNTVTPPDATMGTVCVGTFGGGWPDVPAIGATWTYQDGFPAPG